MDGLPVKTHLVSLVLSFDIRNDIMACLTVILVEAIPVLDIYPGM